MLTLLLDAHRRLCQTCDSILLKHNMGHFHSVADCFSVLTGCTISKDQQIQKPQNDRSCLSADEDEQATEINRMKVELEEKTDRIKRLEKRIEELADRNKTDKIDKMQLIEMLCGVSDPNIRRVHNIDRFVFPQGFRLVDLRLLHRSLQQSQKCFHSKS